MRLSVSIDLGLRRKFDWNFVVAFVSRLIFGADLLSNFGFLLDIRRKRIIDLFLSSIAFATVSHVYLYNLKY